MTKLLGLPYLVAAIDVHTNTHRAEARLLSFKSRGESEISRLIEIDFLEGSYRRQKFCYIIRTSKKW